MSFIHSLDIHLYPLMQQIPKIEKETKPPMKACYTELLLLLIISFG